VKSSNGVPIESNEVIFRYENQMENCKWPTMDAFRNCAFGYWKVTMPEQLNDDNWKQATCTCPTFYKKYICKHIVGVALCLNIKTKARSKMPVAARTIPIKAKRKRGRPAFALPALNLQPFVSLMMMM
jgi:SWIM zinc finger